MKHEEYQKSLREKAVKIVHSRPADIKALDRASIDSLVEELLIHQEELRIQNEELKDVQLILEAHKNRYFSLFENAPNGYVIIDKAGIIKQFNSTFKSMVDSRFIARPNTPFADILVEEDAKTFRARINALFNRPEGKQAEYQIRGQKGGCRHVQVTARPHLVSHYGSSSDMDELLLMLTDITELKQTKENLESSLLLSRSKEKQVRALLKGARGILEHKDFQTTARLIFDVCSDLIGSKSGYVALLSEQGDENEVLFLEAGGMPCSVDPELPMPIRGLREIAYKTQRTVFDNDFMNSEWIELMPDGHVELRNVMFAPLVIENKTVGVIGLANKEDDFTSEDAEAAQGFGELCAIALQNSRNMDKRDDAESKNRRLIADLQEAFANVKQLQGLLPICCHCKKIRDDAGYWQQIESYIAEHTRAEFSHSICRDCAKKYYPDLDVYDD